MADFSVTLDVKDSWSGVDSGYINVDATSGQQYSFKYIGGDDGNGGIVEPVGSGPSNITVTVNDHPRFTIVSCQFNNNEKGDLSFELEETGKSVVITDTDVDVIDGYYKVMVKDNSTPQALLWCDPPIKNRPTN